MSARALSAPENRTQCARRAASVGRALLLLLLPLPARADGQEQLSLDYQSDSGCPDVESFERSLGELTAKVQLSPPSQHTRHVEVRIHILPEGGAAGTLTMLSNSRSEASAERSFHGSTCQEVTDAVALATALLVDPDLLGTSPAPAAEPTVEGDDEDEQDEEQLVTDGTASAPNPEASGASRSRLAVSVSAFGTLGLGTTTLGAALGLEARTELGRLRPSLAVELGAASNFVDERAPLSLSWLPTMRFVLCPHWLGAERSGLSGTLCLAAEAGALRSNARVGFESLQEAVRPWGAGAVELKLRWRAAPFSVELRGGLLVPLVDQSYFASSSGADELLLQIEPRAVGFLGWAGLFDFL